MYDALNSHAEDEDKSTAANVFNGILAVIVLFLWAYVLRSEVRQFIKTKQREGLGEYFKSIWNWFDIAGLSFTIFIWFMTLFRIDAVEIQKLRIIAALTSCFNFIKIFDWLRLFDGTAFYVQLLAATLY